MNPTMNVMSYSLGNTTFSPMENSSGNFTASFLSSSLVDDVRGSVLEVSFER